MTTNQPLSLFISSRMEELVEERRAVQSTLSQYHMYGWLWEKDAGARPESIRQTYLKEVEACDLYIGLFWLGYGPYTIEEFEHARAHKKPCLIYEKHVDITHRDPQLQTFLDDIETVKDDLCVCHFETPEELVERTQNDVLELYEGHKQKQAAKPKQPRMNITSPTNSIIVGYNDGGSITQNNYPQARCDDEQE